MALETGPMVVAALERIERKLEIKPARPRSQLFKAAGVSESTYYRYKEGKKYSPPVETLYRMARFVDEGLIVRVGGYTPGEANSGGTVSPDLAEIAAAMVELSDEDRAHVVKMVQQYAALRRGSSEGSEPGRGSGSRAARRR
jgi:transcriptional regulator with XRE-family HTH domain